MDVLSKHQQSATDALLTSFLRASRIPGRGRRFRHGDPESPHEAPVSWHKFVSICLRNQTGSARLCSKAGFSFTPGEIALSTSHLHSHSETNHNHLVACHDLKIRFALQRADCRPHRNLGILDRSAAGLTPSSTVGKSTKSTRQCRFVLPRALQKSLSMLRCLT